ncbi:MAG: TOBE domain-containing protein, partial [Paracoccaceae bacterium]
YSRPRTEFAASFPGKSNFLRRESRVWALRPEKIDMTPQTARTMGKTTGRVVSMTYFGPLLKYLVAPP